MDKMMDKVQEIPFKSLPQNRLIPWIVAIMCYLATLALGIATYLNETISLFHHDLERSVTVEIGSNHQGFKTLQSQKEQQALQDRLLQALAKYSKAGRLEILNTRPLGAFSTSWKSNLEDPLFQQPILIDVFPKPGQRLQEKNLKAYLARFFQNVKVYQLHPWKQELVDLAWTLLITALAIACLISCIAISIIVFTTYTGLCLHQRTVDILRLIGAPQNFIATRFQSYATSLALKGGLWGMLLATGTFALLFGKEVFQEHLPLTAILFIAPCLLTFLTFIGAKASFTFMIDDDRNPNHYEAI